MDKTQALEFLCRMAEGIAKMFGPTCETLIHDMSVPNHPIVAIYNGSVTGREVGSEQDIFGSLIEKGDYSINAADFVNHLVITSKNKRIKSSTFHMRGQDYHYAIGINFDFTYLLPASDFISDFIRVGTDLKSAIDQAGEGRISEIFDECILKIGKNVENMNKKDRLKLIALLKQQDVFRYQKSVPFVSEKLAVSRYTVYKYINEVENESIE